MKDRFADGFTTYLMMPSLRRMKTNQKGRNTISRNILTMPMIPSFGVGQTKRILY